MENRSPESTSGMVCGISAVIKKPLDFACHPPLQRLGLGVAVYGLDADGGQINVGNGKIGLQQLLDFADQGRGVQAVSSSSQGRLAP